MSEETYLIRYGVMGQVGRFIAPRGDSAPFERGQAVVIESHRGKEIGEVLLSPGFPAAPAGNGDWSAGPADTGADAEADADAESDETETGGRARVVRLAGPDDLARSERARHIRPSRFALCQRVLEEEDWPWEVIDVEALLEEQATVIHYLGPHQIDAAALRAKFRAGFDLDVVLEPAGSDDQADEHDDGDAGGSCGSCDCGSGGGCGSRSAHDHDHGTAVTAGGDPGAAAAHAACASCGISKWLAARSRPAP